MVAPFNYAIDVPNPFEQAISGLKLGATVAEVQAKQQEAQQIAQQRQVAAAEQQRFFSLESPTIQDVMRYSQFIAPEQAKNLTSQFELMNKGQQQSTLRSGGQVLSAIEAGKPEIAVQMLRDMATAQRDPREAKGYSDLASLVESSPGDALKIIGPFFGSLPGAEDVLKGIAKAQETRFAAEKQPAEVRRAIAQADEAERKVQELDISLKTLERVKAAELLKVQSDAERAQVEARFAERLKNLEIEKGKAQAARDRAAAAASMATASQGPAPTVTTVQDPSDPTRTLTIDARRYKGGTLGAEGVIGVGGKTAASAQKEVQAEQGKTLVSDIIDSLKANYNTLDKARAIPSTQRGAWSNILTAVEVSAPGQFVSRAVGSEPQAVRDVIQSSRLQLLNAIKQATGLSSQQLNSNVELQTWLKSVSDPSQQIESVIPILENIEKFVAGGGKKSAPTPTPAPTPASGQPAAGSNQVRTPDGKVLNFPNAEAAARFKQAAGIQ